VVVAPDALEVHYEEPVEILWRKIKYEWLPLDAYLNFKTLTASLFEILKGIGSKYRITFA
jgi:hypothetical protein